jgi:2-dehydropantoate 2-reductase
MRIAIIGAGAIGSLFGAYLSHKNEIIFVGRKDHVDAINSKGLRIEGINNFTLKAHAYTEYNGGAEIIFLTVKSYDTQNAMDGIMEKLENEYIVSLQNGIGNIEIIKKYTKRVIGAITTEASTFVGPGIIRHTGRGITKVGNIYKKDEEMAKKIVNILKESRFNSEYSKNIKNEIWIKGAINSCINPLTAILEIKNGQLRDENISPLIDCLIDENSMVLSSLGIDIDFRSLLLDVIDKTSENYSSMLQDIMHKKRTEIDQITGKIIEYASKKNIEIPCTRAIYHILKEKEKILLYYKK